MAPNERTSPTDTLAQGNCVRRRNPSRGPVGEGLHSHCAWLAEQHQRDLQTLDRIERQMEQAEPAEREVRP